jgi:hypothetical protein
MHVNIGRRAGIVVAGGPDPPHVRAENGLRRRQFVPRIRFGKYSVVLPANRLVRITLGIALVVLGGLFGFLPVLGYWMVPVGFLILATDLPPIRRFNRRMTVAIVGWWNNRKSHEERKAARRNGSSERVAQPEP